MEYTDNNPETGTDSSLTAEQAVDQLTSLFSVEEADDVVDVADDASLDASDDTFEEHPETDSDENDVDVESDETSEEDAVEDAGDPDDDDTFMVALGDEQVSLAELKRGYSRQSDYTKKTTALAEERKTFAQQIDQVAFAVRDLMAREAAQTEALVASLVMAAPDRRLLEDAPGEYLRQQDAYNQQQHALQAVRNRHRQLLAEQEAAQVAQHKAVQAEARDAFFDMHPTLDVRGSGEKQTAEANALFAYGTNLYGAEAMNQLADANMMSTLYKAMLWDRSQKQAAKVATKLQSKPAMARPGTGAPRSTKADEHRKAMAKLRKTGSVEDAVDFLSKL